MAENKESGQHVESLRARMALLEDVVAFYASQETWILAGWAGAVGPAPADLDKGARARAVMGEVE